MWYTYTLTRRFRSPISFVGDIGEFYHPSPIPCLLKNISAPEAPKVKHANMISRNPKDFSGRCAPPLSYSIQHTAAIGWIVGVAVILNDQRMATNDHLARAGDDESVVSELKVRIKTTVQSYSEPEICEDIYGALKVCSLRARTSFVAVLVTHSIQLIPQMVLTDTYLLSWQGYEIDVCVVYGRAVAWLGKRCATTRGYLSGGDEHLLSG